MMLMLNQILFYRVNFFEMVLNKIYQGTCLEVIKTFPDESIDCVITSPPYWQLRDYGWSEQWGLEPTYQLYLEHLWSLMDEVYRVLKPQGTVWINLGDTYSTQSGTNAALARGKKYDNESTYLTNRGESELLIKDKSLPSKCLMLIPHRFAIGCIDRGWIVRNDIIWAKRNGMPESVTDRFSKKHEYIFFMAKNEKYYFDLDGIRDRYKEISVNRLNSGWNGNTDRGFVNGSQNHINKFMNDDTLKQAAIERGKNPGSVSDFWDITTKGNNDEHYAAYNDELIGKPIVAGCPKDGIILDPFAGTATTGCRALELGRKFIGIEGNEKYVEIANRNLLPFIQQQQLF